MEKAREVVREIIEMRSILIGNKKSPTILEQKDRPNNTANQPHLQYSLLS